MDEHETGFPVSCSTRAGRAFCFAACNRTAGLNWLMGGLYCCVQCLPLEWLTDLFLVLSNTSRNAQGCRAPGLFQIPVSWHFTYIRSAGSRTTLGILLIWPWIDFPPAFAWLFTGSAQLHSSSSFHFCTTILVVSPVCFAPPSCCSVFKLKLPYQLHFPLNGCSLILFIFDFHMPYSHRSSCSSDPLGEVCRQKILL